MKKKLIMSCLVHHFSHTNFGGSCSSVWSNDFAINRISYQDERGFLRAEMAKRNEAKNDNDDCGWCCLMDSSQVISRTKNTNYIFCQNYVRWAILNKLSARCMYFYLKKWAIPGPFYRIFLVFSNKHYNFYINICEEMSSQYPYQGSNPKPLGRESPPITTRPGLPPRCMYFVVWKWWRILSENMYIGPILK